MATFTNFTEIDAWIKDIEARKILIG